MNDAAADQSLLNPPREWIRRDPEHVAASTPAFAYPKEIDTQYWAWNDPRWGGEGGKYAGPWGDVLKAAGFKGTPTRADPSGIYQNYEVYSPNPYGGEDVGSQLDFSPEAYAAIDKLRAAGYDLRWKHPDRRTFNTYWGLVTPEGNVQDIKIAGSDLGDMIEPMIKIFGAGLGLAGLGAGINSLLGGAGAGAGAGSALGIAEAMAPGVIAPATAAEMAGVNALLGGAGGALSAADLASLPSDVLGQVGSLSPTNLAELDVFTTPPSSMTPLPTGSPSVTPLTELPPSLGPVTAPTFEFGTLADPTAAITSMPPSVGTIADLAGIPADAGFAAGMGVDAGINALNLGAGAGAVKGVADVAATGATGAATGGGAAVPTAATGAATGGAGIMEGMVPGGLTGSGIPATLGEASAAGAVAAGAGATGGSLLDKAVQLVTSPVGQAVVGGVGSVVGGVLEANAAEKAAETQSQAAANALALQREMFEYQKSLLEPYRTAGTKALERLSGAMGLGGPGSQQQMLEMDPGYGFRLGEGLKALERMQASRGNFLSGGALKAGQRFAQDTASQEYDRAFGRLSDIAGIGRSTSTQMGNAASGFGTSAGNIMGQEANALAAGRLGRTSAYTGAIGGALNSFQNYLNRQQEERLIRDIFGRTTVGG
jgi:hypothetical protein